MEFVDVRLQVPREGVSELRAFYLDRFAFEPAAQEGRDLVAFEVGSAVARFSEAPAFDAPFYHFALLAPGNRFEAAYQWLGARAELLPDPDTGDKVFDFDNWNALACYCLDPAGNIVELIAHRGISESSAEGSFTARELVDFSEVGLVVPDKIQSVAALEQRAGLRVWDGEVADPGSLVFVGERARTLILSHPGRGWLPTRRPAETHPVELTVRGTRGGDVKLPSTEHLVYSL